MSNNKQKAKRKILVVDDELDSFTTFRIALEDNRFDVQKVILGRAPEAVLPIVPLTADFRNIMDSRKESIDK